MPSGAMTCMTAAGWRHLGSFCQNTFFEKSFQSVSGFQRPGCFPSDFTLTKIDLQINIFFYDPGGKIPHFSLPDVTGCSKRQEWRIIWKTRKLSKIWVEKRLKTNLCFISCLILRKINDRISCLKSDFADNWNNSSSEMGSNIPSFGFYAVSADQVRSQASESEAASFYPEKTTYTRKRTPDSSCFG